MSELGWTGMAIPEEYGGTGNTMTDVAVLFEELGPGPCPGRSFRPRSCARGSCSKPPTKTRREKWLPQIASGERVFALALTEAQYGWSADTVRLRRRGRRARISG